MLSEREAKMNGSATRSKWFHDLDRGCLHSVSRDSLPSLEYIGRNGSSSHDFAVDEMVKLDDDVGMKLSWSPSVVISHSLIILWPGKTLTLNRRVRLI